MPSVRICQRCATTTRFAWYLWPALVQLAVQRFDVGVCHVPDLHVADRRLDVSLDDAPVAALRRRPALADVFFLKRTIRASTSTAPSRSSLGPRRKPPGPVGGSGHRVLLPRGLVKGASSEGTLTRLGASRRHRRGPSGRLIGAPSPALARPWGGLCGVGHPGFVPLPAGVARPARASGRRQLPAAAAGDAVGLGLGSSVI
jgi:hypothetical protein